MRTTVRRVRRTTVQGELTQLAEQLADMCGLAAEQARRATQALLTVDRALAEQVLAGDGALDGQRNDCEDHAHRLLALQSPVAGDLRATLVALYCAVNIERMGDLAAHVADTVRLSYPEAPLPPELHATFAELGERVVAMAEHVRELLAGPATPTEGFRELDHADDAVDTVCAGVLATITGHDWPHGVRAASNVALLVRFYERFADQAVMVARRIDFAATGTDPFGPHL